VAKPFKAFISYARRYGTWARSLHEHLEASGERVFLDQTDLGPGRSWVQQLQLGLERAERVVLIVTPEAMASPRVMDEWGALVTAHREYKARGLLQLAFLIDTPLPPFLEDIQYVDFREHDDARYLERLRELLAGLRNAPNKRNLPMLPAGIAPPACPVGLLPVRLRRRLVHALVPACGDDASRAALSGALGMTQAELEGHPSAACAASAAIEHLLRPAKDLREAHAALLPLSATLLTAEVQAVVDEVDRLAP